MKKQIVFIGVLVVLLMSGCKQEQLVEKPELYIEVSSQRLKFGEEITISWQAENASYTINNFCSSKSLSDSYSERLTESKIFWIQAFSSDGTSTLRKVSVVVEPNENDLNVVLLKYKWTHTNMEKDLGIDSAGIHTWLPYTISDFNYIFYPDGKYIVVNMYNVPIGGGDSFVWKLDKDKLILILSGKEYKILSLTKEKMELYSFMTISYFKDTYRADPKP